MDAGVERAALECKKVGALSAGDVDDLDVFTLINLESDCRGDMNSNVEPRFCQRIGRVAQRRRQHIGARDQYKRVGGGGLIPDCSTASRCANHEDRGSLRDKGHHFTRRRIGVEDVGGLGAADINTPPKQPEANARCILST